MFVFSFACRGLQDELFNLTLDQLRIKAERTRAEAKLNGSIQRIQLDNQMLVRPLLPVFFASFDLRKLAIANLEMGMCTGLP